jgi:hypothetical protein
LVAVGAVADVMVGGLDVEEGRDFRWAGTFRFMFSSASRRSAWKSGWRNVQLWSTSETMFSILDIRLWGRGRGWVRTCSPNWLSSVFLTWGRYTAISNLFQLQARRAKGDNIQGLDDARCVIRKGNKTHERNSWYKQEHRNRNRNENKERRGWGRGTDLVKIIFIKLPNETREIGVLEHAW